MPGVIADITAAAEGAARNGFPARAAKYDAIAAELIADLQEAGIQSSKIADAAIRAKFDASRGNRGRIRPENTGQLRKAIRSQPIPTAFPLGAIGIANIDELDQVVNPRTGGAYWTAQEWGYDFRGRKLVGYFFNPGQAAPSADAFRLHAYFQTEGKTGARKVPGMVVKKAVLARHFLRDGAAVGVEANLKLRAAAYRKADLALKSLL